MYLINISVLSVGRNRMVSYITGGRWIISPFITEENVK